MSGRSRIRTRRKNTRPNSKLIIGLIIIASLVVLIAIFLLGKAIIKKYKSNKPKVEVSEFYKPTEEEITRAKELEEILKNKLPTMDGATFTIPLEGGIISTLYETPQEEAEIKIVHSTDYEAFNSLVQGKCDIIFSLPLSRMQYEDAEDSNIELVEVPIAYQGVVFIVNKNNPVDTLTKQQIKDIYSGRITNWKEVGGNDEEIIAYQKNETSECQKYMKEFMGESNLIEPKINLVPDATEGVVEEIAVYDNSENAIGYSIYCDPANMYGNEIKFIKVDGIEPTKETMVSQEYPLLNCIYAIYNKAKENESAVKELTEWLLTYNGQLAIAKAGYIPTKNIEVEDTKIVPYTLKGISEEERDENADNFYYYIAADNLIDNNEGKILILKDKDLQNKVNTFIENSKNDLENKLEDCDKYVELLNKNNRNLYCSNGIKISATCINGYLSIKVYLEYEYQVQSGYKYTYDGYSKIYDLYTGEELELNDLFYNDLEFVAEINKQIEKRIPRSIDLSVLEVKTKRTFSALPDTGYMYTINEDGNIVITFPKNNLYFAEGVDFNIDTYINNLSVIYKARDMLDMFDEDIEISKRIYLKNYNSISKEKTDNYNYNIYYLETEDISLNNIVNEYIESIIVDDNYINKLVKEDNTENEEEQNTTNIKEENKPIINIDTKQIGNKYIVVDVYYNYEGIEEITFDAKTGKKVSYDEAGNWLEKNNIEY